MRRIPRLLLCAVLLTAVLTCSVYAAETNEEELNLNARAAVLMDADSGRVLYGKDAETAYPMASTTKVMTLIIALEEGDPETVVTASAYAASMPEVHLGVREGEQYRMGDLYYALMLESYNDAAVMIAEGIAGSVADFADLMNEKALLLGCRQTHFVTPNGLDGSDADGVHASTARDMALIMRYAIEKEAFLEITQTRSYSFTDVGGSRSYSLSNKNSLFDRMEGVLSGKTGYTGEAGYCYVCAVQMGDKCLVAALLGSGWPPNKNYKWQDVAALMAYGDEHYSYRQIQLSDYAESMQVHLIDGEQGQLQLMPAKQHFQCLMADDEQLHVTAAVPGELKAPLEKGTEVGEIHLYLEDCLVGRGCFYVPEAVPAQKDRSLLRVITDFFGK